MAGQGREQFGATKAKETTPLLVNDLENAYGTTTASTSGKNPAGEQQTLWEWTKAEVKCYSKYMCPVILANCVVLVIILAYFGVLS